MNITSAMLKVKLNILFLFDVLNTIGKGYKNVYIL